MYKYENQLGDVIKYTRKDLMITQKELAKKTGIKRRYVIAIENEQKYPSFIVLYKLIRILCINPELIFYPERPYKGNRIEEIVRMLKTLDKHSVNIVYEMVKALTKE